MKNMFSILPEELDQEDRQEYVSAAPSSMLEEPIEVVEEQEPISVEGRSRPANMNLGMPIDRSPLIIQEDSLPVAAKEASIIERYKEMMNKQKQTDDSEYEEASGKNNRMQLYGNLLKGFQGMIQNSVSGVAPNFKADMSVADGLINQGKEGMSEYYKKRSNAREEKNQIGSDLSRELSLGSGEIDLNEKRAYTDPNSPIASVYKNFLKQNFKKYLPDMSEEEIDALSPQRSAEIVKMLTEQEKAKRDGAIEWARLNQQNDIAKLAADAKREAKVENDMQKLEKRVQGGQNMAAAYNGLESSLGFNLDDANVVNGELLVKGKKVDLPGANLPGLGRVSFYDSNARGIKASADKIFNVTLKDRSGAAVTTPEMDRLKSEYESGKFNTEAELVMKLKEFKREVARELKNREAGFSKEARTKYKEEGGVLSDVFERKQTTAPSPSPIDLDNDPRIDSFMKKNKKIKSREEAIRILKKAEMI